LPGSKSLPTKKVQPTLAHLRLRQELLDLVSRHSQTLSKEEVLAVLAYTVGQTLALQDQLYMTPARGMQLIAENIEAGNQDVIQALISTSEGHA
jgi:hypothetical protein